MIITKEYIAELNPDLPIDAEEWRPIVGYTGLLVSNYGNIKRLATSISYFRKDINRQITRNMPEKMYGLLYFIPIPYNTGSVTPPTKPEIK